MKISIKDALMLQQGVRLLMKDGNLTIKCKLDVVTLAEGLDDIMKPFMAVRAEVVAKYTTTNEDGTSSLNREAIEKELSPIIEEEKDLGIDAFVLDTTPDDKNITSELILIFKRIFKENFTIA